MTKNWSDASKVSVAIYKNIVHRKSWSWKRRKC